MRLEQFISTAALVLLFAQTASALPPNCPATDLSGLKERRAAVVRRVIDGDTLILRSGERVRLIGVDAPETARGDQAAEKFAVEATGFTRRQLEGQTVYLVFDENRAATRHRDRFGRLLAYLYRASDGMDLNANLIEQGYARAFTRFPFERLEEFRCLERRARRSHSGLWK